MPLVPKLVGSRLLVLQPLQKPFSVSTTSGPVDEVPLTARGAVALPAVAAST